ncbi:MAG: ribosome small subunit-dependent GTPase A [Flavobacteriales bacterium AspAUS03]
MKGMVVKSTGSWYTIRHAGGYIQARIKGKLRIDVMLSTNPIAVGDWVSLEPQTDKTAMITQIHERKNYIIRRAVKLSKQTHVLAANIDQCFLMVTLSYPSVSTGFIDRFLVCAEAYRIPTILLFNKIDLHNETLSKQKDTLIDLYTKVGYDCLELSTKKRQGIDPIKTKMTDKVSMIAGNSGTGKSTLINTLAPGWKLRTGMISNYHQKGQHITTFAELFEWPFGGQIIDTPGIKGFGLVDMAQDETQDYFPEIFRQRGQCRFYNCLHLEEPGCAVIKAVDEKEIAPSRYSSYCAILEDEKGPYRMEDWT